VIKGGIIAIKSSRNQAFAGIISFSAGSLSDEMGFEKLVFMRIASKFV